MKGKTPSEEPRPPESFIRFYAAVKRLLTVSKTELNARLAAERARKRQQKSE